MVEMAHHMASSGGLNVSRRHLEMKNPDAGNHDNQKATQNCNESSTLCTPSHQILSHRPSRFHRADDLEDPE